MARQRFRELTPGMPLRNSIRAGVDIAPIDVPAVSAFWKAAAGDGGHRLWARLSCMKGSH
jgi:hypothetical protein